MWWFYCDLEGSNWAVCGRRVVLAGKFIIHVLSPGFHASLRGCNLPIFANYSARCWNYMHNVTSELFHTLLRCNLQKKSNNVQSYYNVCRSGTECYQKEIVSIISHSPMKSIFFLFKIFNNFEFFWIFFFSIKNF